MRTSFLSATFLVGCVSIFLSQNAYGTHTMGVEFNVAPRWSENAESEKKHDQVGGTAPLNNPLEPGEGFGHGSDSEEDDAAHQEIYGEEEVREFNLVNS